MDWKRAIREKLPHLSPDLGRQEEIVEELALDLNERYQRALRDGAGHDEATRLALAELDDPEFIAREIGAAQRPLPPRPAADHGLIERRGGLTTMFADFTNDLRYAVRMLVKSPLFTAVAVLSLALGIGLNTTIFTLVNALLLNPLPVQDPSSLVAQFTTDTKNTARFQNFMGTSYPNFRDHRDQNPSYAGLAAYQGVALSLSSNGEPEQIFGEMVTGNYFDVLGVKTVVGRTFSFTATEDEQLGAHPEVVLSHALWKRRFGADPGTVGKTILINRQGFVVAGVARENFRGVNAVGGPLMWVPISMWPQVTTGVFRDFFDDRRALLLNIAGRLKPGVTIGQADASAKTIAKQLEDAFPKENDSRSATLRPLTEATFFSPEFRTGILAAGGSLMLTVGVVLLIACTNVANLLLARAAARQREVAVRLSLGASRARLVRQLLTESLLLALIAGGLGLLFAYWSRDVLWSLRPPFLQADALTLPLDGRVLAFTVGASLFTGLLFGLIPALSASRPDLAVALKDRSNQPSGAHRRFGLRNVLVMAEVALSLVALVGAGLFLRSMQEAQAVNPGFETERMMVLSFDTGAEGFTRAKALDLFRQVTDRVRALPMVESAEVAWIGPLAGAFQRTVFPEGMDMNDRRNGKLTALNHVMPGYFQTVGIPILRGRAFTEADREGAPMVAIINETMARNMWPEQDPIGKRFRCFGEPWILEIVGIARDAKYFTLGETPQPFFYMPLLQHDTPQVTLHVRTKGDPSAAVGTVRNTVQSLDRQMPLNNVNTTSELFSQALWAPRMGASMLGVFGLLALALAAIGVHGVMSYSVAQRTQEIGIRMALGARPGDVIRLVLRQAMFIVGVGAVVGLGGTFVATFLAERFLTEVLFVKAGDPLAFVGTAGVLAVVALFACYLPARRASRIDPLIALRYE